MGARYRVITLLFVLVVTAGCAVTGTGSPSGGTSTSASSTPTSTTAVGGGGSAGGGSAGGGSGGGSGGSGGSGGGSGGDSSGFSWVPFGPADPANPDAGVRSYSRLETRDCDSSQPDSDNPLWQAVYAMCSAALTGDESKWEQAAAPVGSSQGTCLDKAAAELLRRALAWHRAHPGLKPTITLPAAGSKACPFRIDDVQIADDNGNPTGGALQGPLEGGTQLMVTAEGCSGDDTVLIGGLSVAATPDYDGPPHQTTATLTVTVPHADHAGPVAIVLRNRAGEARASKKFTYVEASPPANAGTQGG
jgi:hypothetical protein